MQENSLTPPLSALSHTLSCQVNILNRCKGHALRSLTRLRRMP
ncbi:hypothetical protein HMPREF3038_01328 [Akkermansia sp. KLE1797]|nr:hypothetical protein HMPREF3038_01328 [Akkermansia sp. KLE1797]